MLRCVDLQICSDDSEGHSVVPHSALPGTATIFWLTDPEDVDTTMFQNTSKYLPVDTA